MTRSTVLLSLAVALSLALGVAAADAQTKEGIGVSGYWKIDVRNPDGTLASHTEFENALTGDGQGSLVNLLFGASTVQSMGIQLVGPIDASPCVYTILGLTIAVPCFIEGSALTSAVQVNPVGALVLTGSTTATNNGLISGVSTLTNSACGAGLVTCAPINFHTSFTGFALSGGAGSVPPIPVTAGQIVQVSVTLSFS